MTMKVWNVRETKVDVLLRASRDGSTYTTVNSTQVFHFLAWLECQATQIIMISLKMYKLGDIIWRFITANHALSQVPKEACREKEGLRDSSPLLDSSKLLQTLQNPELSLCSGSKKLNWTKKGSVLNLSTRRRTGNIADIDPRRPWPGMILTTASRTTLLDDPRPRPLRPCEEGGLVSSLTHMEAYFMAVLQRIVMCFMGGLVKHSSSGDCHLMSPIKLSCFPQRNRYWYLSIS